MNKWRTIFVFTITATVLIFSASCDSPQTKKQSQNLIPQFDLGTTIGSLVDISNVDTIPVEGYNLVGGLNGTGSSECPAALRDYLSKYILARLSNIDVNKFIADQNTAVVQITGVMPMLATNLPYFDLKVEALAGTQTTSLKNGVLYGAELKVKKGVFNTLPVLATAEGPVFIDPFDSNSSQTSGYILAGGTRQAKFKMSLKLKKPDFQTANLISNRLRARFGDQTANAVSPAEISLSIPEKYARQQDRFLEIVKATYIADNRELTEQRITTYIRKLAVSDDGQGRESEIALETIGKPCLRKLSGLLNVSDEMVRLRAARCMLNLGSDEGLNVLRDIANDVDSDHRFEAIEAISLAANKKDASGILRRLLRDEDFDIRLAVYKQLQQLEDLSITTIPIAKNFNVELVPQAMQNDIYVTRSGIRRIVIFAATVECVPGILVTSDDGNIMLTADQSNEFVWVIRKHPTQPDKIVKLKSSFRLSQIVETLCHDPKNGGLSVSYGDAIALIKKMCDKNLVPATFHVGPLPEIAAN